MKKYKALFISCFVAAGIGTLSLFSVLFSANISTNEHKIIFDRILGSVFWVSFIAELILVYQVDLQRKVISIIEGYGIEYGKAGAFCFRKNIFGKTADIVMAASVIVIIVMMMMNIHTRSAVIICSGLLYLSSVMHCIFNGKNFRFFCDHINKGEIKHEEK